jgi:hypothetical protein
MVRVVGRAVSEGVDPQGRACEEVARTDSCNKSIHLHCSSHPPSESNTQLVVLRQSSARLLQSKRLPTIL